MQRRPAPRAASSPPRARSRPPSGRSARSMRSPWKAGSISLRCARCALLVEQDHRVRADDGLEDARALAGVQHLGRRGEDLLDLVRVGHVHERRGLEQPQREALAVARAAALEEGDRARPPCERLNGTRGPRTGRQMRHGLRTVAPHRPPMCDLGHRSPRPVLEQDHDENEDQDERSDSDVHSTLLSVYTRYCPLGGCRNHGSVPERAIARNRRALGRARRASVSGSYEKKPKRG